MKTDIQSVEGKVERFVVAGVAQRAGCVLLLRRKKEDFMGGIYELPSGKVEEGESLFEALRREVNEETGLHVAEIGREVGRFKYRSQTGRLTEQRTYRVTLCDGPVLLTEHDKAKWVCPVELNDIRMSEETREVIKNALCDD
ncbi:8-oxo-dGTP diphosphatase [Pseudomonas sp. NFR09]|uniref:NUDIX domain-containing protein n=1 Tax=Pseudomonas sp. NFR09 TaxID=1566249 RepID=UPI0008ACFAB3|nr:NUDIX domain-containing protein [Pseudomonas sp. NFR09]SEU14322.1 8-oxo-dGTP diphosphatase [Pseudomonas sp. NFR09]